MSSRQPGPGEEVSWPAVAAVFGAILAGISAVGLVAAFGTAGNWPGVWSVVVFTGVIAVGGVIAGLRMRRSR